MNASIHVIPAAGIRAETDLGSRGGSGIATAAMRTAEQLGADADLVLVAVAPGQGALLAKYLQEGRAAGCAQPPARGAQ